MATFTSDTLINYKECDLHRARATQWLATSILVVMRHNQLCGFSAKILKVMERKNHVIFISSDGRFIVSQFEPGDL